MHRRTRGDLSRQFRLILRHRQHVLRILHHRRRPTAADVQRRRFLHRRGAARRRHSWQRGGRRILAALFALGFVIGALGIWFHSGGHPLTHVLQVLSAWHLPPGQNGGIKVGTQPPTFAPAAFWGLGSIGLIACFTRTAAARIADGP